MNEMRREAATPIAPNEQHLLEQALQALWNSTGLTARQVERDPNLADAIQPDAVIELQAAGNSHTYAAEIKRIDRFAALGQVKHRLDQMSLPGLLIAPRITDDMADRCRELGIQFLDAAGNAYLYGAEWFVLVKGQRPPDKDAANFPANGARQAGTATSLKVIFALLCRPNLLNAPYREIMQAANVALGTIGGVLLDLNQRGFTTGGQKKGTRRLLERQRLIDEWVTHFPIRLRPKLNPRRFRAAAPGWWRGIDITHYDALWGGEVAAEQLTGQLKPAAVTLYMKPEARQNLTRLVADNQLRADPSGDIEVLEAFWNLPAEGEGDTVPPLLIYADLLATMDPRNFEMARLLHQRLLRDPEAQG